MSSVLHCTVLPHHSTHISFTVSSSFYPSLPTPHTLGTQQKILPRTTEGVGGGGGGGGEGGGGGGGGGGEGGGGGGGGGGEMTHQCEANKIVVVKSLHKISLHTKM